MYNNLVTSSNKIASYDAKKILPNGNIQNTKLNIYRLNEKDIPFLEDLKNAVKKRKIDLGSKEYSADNTFQYNIMNAGLFQAIHSLKINSIFDRFAAPNNMKPICLLAEAEGDFCGLLVGNTPKIDTKKQKIVYSHRKNDNEVEIDYLGASKMNKNNAILKGAAPALISEFFMECKNLSQNVEKIFLRSAIPEVSKKALAFYKKMGFEISGEREYCNYINAPVNLTDLFAQWDKVKRDTNDKFIPVEISLSKAVKKAEEIRNQFNYSKCDEKNISIGKIINLEG